MMDSKTLLICASPRRMGTNAMLDGKPLETHLSRKRVVPAFDRFIQNICEGSASPARLYEEAQRPPGKWISLLLARVLTRKVRMRIRHFGHNPEAPNYYLTKSPK